MTTNTGITFHRSRLKTQEATLFFSAFSLLRSRPLGGNAERTNGYLPHPFTAAYVVTISVVYPAAGALCGRAHRRHRRSGCSAGVDPVVSARSSSTSTPRVSVNTGSGTLTSLAKLFPIALSPDLCYCYWSRCPHKGMLPLSIAQIRGQKPHTKTPSFPAPFLRYI